METKVVSPENLVFVPVEVPTPTAAVVVGFTLLTALGVAAVAIAYSVGVDEGHFRARQELNSELNQRMRDLEARHASVVESAKRGGAHHKPEART